MIYFLDTIIPIINMLLILVGGFTLIRLLAQVKVNVYRLGKTEQVAENTAERANHIEVALEQVLSCEKRIGKIEAHIESLYDDALIISRNTDLANKRITSVENMQNQLKEASSGLLNLERVVREIQRDKANA